MNSESQASEAPEAPSSADKPNDASISASASASTATDAKPTTTETQPTTSESASETKASEGDKLTDQTDSAGAVTSESADKESSSAVAAATPAEPKKSSPARMSLSFIQGDEPKQPEVKESVATDKTGEGHSVAQNATSSAPSAPAAPAADTTANESAASDATVLENTASGTSPGVNAPVDNADAAAVAADDADAPAPNPKEPKSMLKHAHVHPHSHKHHHHHHHHHRSFRNLKSKQDVNNKDVYSFVKSTPFPKTDLGVLEYTTNLDTCLQGVLLPNLQLHVDCTIQVLIPRKHLRKESNILVQRREIWGTDIYTDDSDVVSVLYHTGVLPTRAQVDAFYSTLRAQEEGHGDDATDGHLEDEHPVTVGPNSHLVTSTSDNEQIYGDCLVTLRALPKLTEYTGCYRNGINSRSWKHHDGGSFAIQKVEFLKHDQAEYVLRRNKRSRLNTWSDQQKWAEWSSHKEVVLDFKDDAKGKKATVESLYS